MTVDFQTKKVLNKSLFFNLLFFINNRRLVYFFYLKLNLSLYYHLCDYNLIIKMQAALLFT